MAKTKTNKSDSELRVQPSAATNANMSKSAQRDTKSHVSHISQDYCDVKEGKKGQPHELHEKYVHPSTNHDPKLAFNQKMDIERESRKQHADKEIEAEEREIEKSKNESQSKKMPVKK
ncbi:12531_t:CDS:2 [Dentiscutata erythropus]|uniref:12531_t:CDS:1 n=1 Tax=Dentiscutata erythropus TaxID=1348616 RepID=A0A9N9F1V3_9GLOM|nr:12531_t:CDS:2 [Dentiscutata erythropus]